MFGTLALAAAILFVVLGIARLRASPLKVLAAGVPLAAGLAGVFALLHWHGIGDTRWMVGGILMFAALAMALVQGNRTLATGALVIGLLVTILFGIATVSPARTTAVAVA